MDELIREMQGKARSAYALRNMQIDEETRKHYDTIAQTWEHAVYLAQDAKRRMAEREPAWDLRP